MDKNEVSLSERFLEEILKLKFKFLLIQFIMLHCLIICNQALNWLIKAKHEFGPNPELVEEECES